MSAALKVTRAGLFDTLQDLGRIGFMALGMPTAGAMDRVALRLANALCGNPPGTAGIEIGVMGPDLLVEADSVRIALVGPLSPALIETPDAPPKPLESDRTHLLKRGQILKVGMIEGSSTAYLAVAGGFALPPFMGSLSTYARAGVGGFQGRKLAAGDSLPLVRDQASPGGESKLGQPFDYGSGPIRIVWGPQDDHFSARGRRTFIESDYRVSKEADRMGIRFEGPTIEHAVQRRQGRRRHHLRRHRARRHPGAGRRPADRAVGRPADRGRLSQDRHRGLGRPAEAGPPAAGPERPLRPRHGRRGRAVAPRAGGADPARARKLHAPRGRRAASTSCGSTKRT